MVDVPLQPALKNIVPVLILMMFPPALLAASRLYVIPVLFVAVAWKGTVAAPWQRTEVAPLVNTGVPTLGVIVTVCVRSLGPLQPWALAVICAVPLKPAAYVTTPVAEFIVFPAAMLPASRL
jgi:hypothetical protein